jgi:two-component system cell cycle sensor histidine kinase/response regulator CckA
MYFDLALNLSLLIALCGLAGFVSTRLGDGNARGAIFLGCLFGLAIALAMFRPAVVEPGVIFDGRSVMISVCSLYFGPLAAVTAGAIAIVARVGIGGPGLPMGLVVIVCSLGLGLFFRRLFGIPAKAPTTKQLFVMGVAVHLAFIAAIFALPRESALHTLKHVAIPVMLLYPIATVFAGHIVGVQRQLNQSLNELQRMNELQSIMLRSIGDGIIAADLEGRVTLINPAAEKFSGWSSLEAKGRPLTEVVRVTPPLPTNPPTEEQSDLPPQTEILSRTGERFFLGGMIAPLKNKDGRFLGVVLTLRNRTDEIESERALRLSEQRHRSLVEHSPDIILRCNQAHQITFANPVAEALLGWKVDVTRPRTLREMELPDDECQRFEEACKMLRKTGEPQEFELLHRGPSGEIALVARLIPESDRSGNVLALIQDVTERRRSEGRMHLLTAALNAAANAIIITDSKGLIEWVNPAFSRYTLYSFDEVIGLNPGEILGSGKHPKEFYQVMWATIGAGKVWSGEMINRRKDGTIYTEDMMITPIIDAHGQITHHVAVKQDISQRKSLEAQARHSQKMDAIGQLAGGVAHDFNNILASVMLNVGLLQMEPGMDPIKKQMLADLEKEIMRGATLARQLLTFSRQQAMEMKPLDLHEVVSGLLRMLTRLVGEGVKIVLNSSQDLPRIRADVGMIEQVVVNLVVNARDAMPTGGRVEIRIQACDVAADHVLSKTEARVGNFVRLTVTDTGHGMDDKVLEKIFEPFFTTKTPGKGTGLGLATVHGIVKQHGGWIEVESVVGKGTCFDIYFEACLDKVPILPPPRPQRQRVGTGETILLAEDEASVRLAIAGTLRRHGYKVITARNAHEALAKWSGNQVSIKLLITDMIMPENMNGLELASKLRESEPSLKVVICTGYSSDLLPSQLPQEPLTLVLKKPFQPSTLLAVLRQVFEPTDQSV